MMRKIVMPVRYELKQVVDAHNESRVPNPRTKGRKTTIKGEINKTTYDFMTQGFAVIRNAIPKEILQFALDVSKSMLAEDIAPNRLEKSKQIISKIIDKLGSDRVGIIIYAGNAYPLLPITTDHGAAKMFLQNANPDLVSSQGTAIKEALDLAKTYYNNDDQTNRFLIIISDGEDHQEETKQLAQNISNEGVKVYTIGVGSEKGAPIPMKINGSLIGYKKYKGETVLTKRNSELLKGVANVANGNYIDGNLTDKPVKAIEEIISNAQKTEFETKQFSDYKDQFQWFLAIGLLFLILDVFLLDKKTRWLKKINLFNEKDT